MKTDLHRRFLIGLAILFMVAFHALAIDVKTATIEQLDESGVFVTMFIGIIDLQTGQLDYCNCGHNPPIFGERMPKTHSRF